MHIGLGDSRIAGRVLHACICLLFCEPSSAEGGLRGKTDGATPLAVARRTLTDLASQFTHTNGSSRLEDMEKALAPMYSALPKDEHGRLKHEVVRYALHRIFVARHSWYVRGLEAIHNTPKIADSFPEQNVSFDLDGLPFLPSFLQNTIEQEHVGVGLSLTELAALAASIEDLAHKESTHRLEQAYGAMELNKQEKLSGRELTSAIETYFTIYLLGFDFADWTHNTVRERTRTFRQSKRFQEFRPWLDKLRKDVSVPDLENNDGLSSFNDAARIVEAISDNYGRFNDMECHGMKRELISLEGRKPGRVRLSDFYNQTLSKIGMYWFGEKIDYLRALGALDESNLSNPQVIIVNYVSSPPNCVRVSSVYDVCCNSECESFMGQLESAIGAPESSPEIIMHSVALLASDTSKARTLLPESLRQRLFDIAKDYGGRVPLHSRKFALWMHHVFPRECPFPHEEGTTMPLTADEWMQSSGQNTQMASEEEMLEHIRPDDTCSINSQPCKLDVSQELPWLDYKNDPIPEAFHDNIDDTLVVDKIQWVPIIVWIFPILLGAVILTLKHSRMSKGGYDLGAKVF
eukprot:TRINITY_DN23322_c0_g1_i1.p1 TRINITY_DN23322_c0_g1~~TRINITY_DN23322_c0_g1_i1.p1  ORF type:complete len:576 (+),score=74.23 TRINITY_DN23322_c0_g1_i1:66-1793(+)